MTETVALPRRLISMLHIGAGSGWGVFGGNLALQATARGIHLVPVGMCDFETLEPGVRKQLAGVEESHRNVLRQIREFQKAGKGNTFQFQDDVLHCMGNDLAVPKLDYLILGKRNFGAVFLECAHISASGVASGKTLNRIFAGSTWNLQILKKHGLENARVALQGIDPALFCPGPRERRWGEQFVVFSGGKLEYRKGQDLVVAAFAKFSRRHPDALLAFAWHNPWRHTMAEIDRAGLVRGVPVAQENGSIDFGSWLKSNGVENFVDLGKQFNYQMPPLLREADVAIFPNRCEGGTNLVAMEAMACAVPTILSANTGHLDLIRGENCFSLEKQGNVTPTETYKMLEGWGESSVDEIVENLERVYEDREEAKRRGMAGAATLREMSWENQIDHLLAEMG